MRIIFRERCSSDLFSLLLENIFHKGCLRIDPHRPTKVCEMSENVRKNIIVTRETYRLCLICIVSSPASVAHTVIIYFFRSFDENARHAKKALTKKLPLIARFILALRRSYRCFSICPQKINKTTTNAANTIVTKYKAGAMIPYTGIFFCSISTINLKLRVETESRKVSLDYTDSSVLSMESSNLFFI